MIADSPQREEALDPARSFIVEAPAGSGKTGLLVQRVLRLLSGVDRPEAVVAITFTVKAASEMKQRIVKALQDATDNVPTEMEFEARTRQLALAALERDRKNNWNLLADHGRLQVQTIDSLCALLTRQMPVLSEFGSVGEVVEDPKDLYTLAAREMLVSLTEGSAEDQALFHRMALHFDNDMGKLERHLVKMLEKRDQWEELAAENDSQLVADFCKLVREARRCLLNVFQRSGKVDFAEIARAAQRSLGSPEAPTDLLYSLDYRIQHLLVDEFQDTSRAQYELVRALTEQWSEGDGHTLFLVGDPMQSIYGFREADVSLFLRSWQECRLGAVRLTPVRLETNFRTTNAILDWVQNSFTDVMPSDDVQNGAVKFRASQSGRADTGAVPRLIPLVNDAGSEEAEEVVRIIQREKASRDIAILVRSRPQLAAILPALRSAEIGYEAVQIDNLQQEQHIIDLLSLTRAIVHLGDRTAWLACLRAPWCGLTLGDLAAIAENDQKTTIFDLLSNAGIIETLSVDGRWRAVRFLETMTDAMEALGRTGLRNLMETAWMRLGGLASLTAAHHKEDAATYFDMLESMEEAGTVLDFSLLLRKLEVLFAKPSTKECRVKVMTAYQAKGLEFDVVIIPRLGKLVRNVEDELLVWTEEGERLSIAALPKKGQDKTEYERINEIRKQKDRNETARLFYVACTRAKNSLYLLGSATSVKGKLYKPRTGSFLELLWAKVVPEFEEVARGRMPKQSGLFNLQNQGKATICRLPANWTAPIAERSIKWEPRVRRVAASSRPTSYEWVSDSGRHTGTVVHALLKQITADGLKAWSVPRVNTLMPLIGAELLRLGVARDELAAASKRVIAAVSNSLASERGRWIVGEHTEDHSEWAVVGNAVSGIVDRAFRDTDGRFWIVDFKTSDHKGAGLNEFLSSEKHRYSEQLENYAGIVSQITTGPVWLGLYFPLQDAWLEWQYAPAAEAAS